MKKTLVTLLALMSAAALFALPVSAAAKPVVVDDSDLPVSNDTSDQNWTDPDTGYVYKDGVNATIQGDIALLSDEGAELPADDFVVSDPTGQNWTDPDTGYTYENGVNTTVQGDIALYSEEGTEVAPITEAPKTGVTGASFGAALVAFGGVLALKKRKD